MCPFYKKFFSFFIKVFSIVFFFPLYFFYTWVPVGGKRKEKKKK